MPQTWSELVGLPVLDIGNETVCSLLSDKILHTEMYEHSYPYDWRTKLPVIVRASKQWFLDTAAIKNQSIVNIYLLQYEYSSYLLATKYFSDKNGYNLYGNLC